MRFEGLQSASSSSLEISSLSGKDSPQDTSQPKENESSDEEFYSPPNSPEVKEKDIVHAQIKKETNEMEKPEKLSLENTEELPPSLSPHTLTTPRARRSYRSEYNECAVLCCRVLNTTLFHILSNV